ncbi:MAG: ABC transporter ATP-binding protein [Burkholderiales bacterium]|jgi:branched-chain amino acid transport system ATP-binding protein|nr:ABC transporter ATP-binding protein [Burkholderiales bacterium]
MNSSQSLLSVRDLVVHYGGIEAVKGISFEIAQGECVSLIGANGAGKTTTLKAITGTLPAATVQGTITYANQFITAIPAFNLPSLGLAMVPEGRGVFARMSIKENLLMGAYTRRDHSEIEADIEKWFTIFPRLKERADQLAGTLSGGEQQMLVMARALMSKPQLLLLDEPSMGLAPIMVERIFEVIKAIAAEGIAILLVEQNVRQALSLTQRAYVMDTGTITLSGMASELLNNPEVIHAYLGG